MRKEEIEFIGELYDLKKFYEDKLNDWDETGKKLSQRERRVSVAKLEVIDRIIIIYKNIYKISDK